MEVIEISMRQYPKELVGEVLYEIGCEAGSHTFAAVQDEWILGVAIISANPLGRGYTINHIAKTEHGNDSVYESLLDAIEEFCENNNATELRIRLYFKEALAYSLLKTLETRGFEDVYTRKNCLVYFLNEVERIKTYDSATEDQIKLLNDALKSYDDLSDAELRSLEKNVSHGESFEDIDLSNDIYSSYLCIKNKVYGYIDVRALDNEIFMIQDEYHMGGKDIQMMYALLTRSFEELKNAGFKNPIFIIPVTLDGLEKGGLKFFGEPHDRFEIISSQKRLGVSALTEIEEEDTRYKLVFIQDQEVYSKFAPLFPKGISYYSGEYMVLGAVDSFNNQPAGVVALSASSREIGIEYIYVDRKYRGELIGAWFIDTIKEYALSSGMPKEVTCSFGTNNEELFGFFFNRFDMNLSIEGDTYLITPNDIEESDMLHRILKGSDTKNTCLADIIKNDETMIDTIIKQINGAKSNDFPYIDMELSQVLIVNGELRALILFGDYDDDTKEISYIMSKDPSDRSDIYLVIRNAVKAYRKICHEKNIRASVLKGALNINALFPDVKPIGGICVARWNFR